MSRSGIPVYIEWLLNHEVPDMTGCRYLCVVDDGQLTSARIPLGIHNALHVLGLLCLLLIRVMTVQLDSAGFYLRTISMAFVEVVA